MVYWDGVHYLYFLSFTLFCSSKTLDLNPKPECESLELWRRQRRLLSRLRSTSFSVWSSTPSTATRRSFSENSSAMPLTYVFSSLFCDFPLYWFWLLGYLTLCVVRMCQIIVYNRYCICLGFTLVSFLLSFWVKFWC